MRAVVLALLTSIAACSSGGDDDNPGIDAPPGAKVTEVTPCTGESATIMTLGTRFEPMAATITTNQVVKFVNDVGHDIKPNGTMSDAALAVPDGQTKCFKFTAAGTYNFRCSIHGFVGSITVN
jgi:plastocyanin